MTNIYIALVLLVAYIVILCYRNATIPSSLANSFFRLAPVGKWLMVAVVTTVAVLTGRVVFYIAPHAWIAVAIFSLVLSTVSVLTEARTSHKVGTILFYLCLEAYVFPCFWLFAISWVPWLFWFIWVTKDHPWRTQCFWAEITCICNFFSYTIYQILLE
jgi:hypothetical protein